MRSFSSANVSDPPATGAPAAAVAPPPVVVVPPEHAASTSENAARSARSRANERGMHTLQQTFLRSAGGYVRLCAAVQGSAGGKRGRAWCPPPANPGESGLRAVDALGVLDRLDLVGALATLAAGGRQEPEAPAGLVDLGLRRGRGGRGGGDPRRREKSPQPAGEAGDEDAEAATEREGLRRLEQRHAQPGRTQPNGASRRPEGTHLEREL